MAININKFIWLTNLLWILLFHVTLKHILYLSYLLFPWWQLLVWIPQIRKGCGEGKPQNLVGVIEQFFGLDKETLVWCAFKKAKKKNSSKPTDLVWLQMTCFFFSCLCYLCLRGLTLEWYDIRYIAIANKTPFILSLLKKYVNGFENNL